MKTVLVFVAVCATPTLFALDLGDFRTCVSASGSGSTCTLDLGTYELDGSSGYGPITIGRSNLIVQGYVSDPTQVILRRATSSVSVPYLMNLASGVNNITVEGFSFDGNKFSYPTAFNPESLDMNPESSTYWITVQYCDFSNELYPIIFSIYVTIVEYCTFSYSGPVFEYNSADVEFTYQYVESNTFDTDAESVIVFNNTEYAYILDNTINNPYSGTFTDSHGSVVLEAPNSNITVEDNSFNGGNQTGSGGAYMEAIEGYGSYHYIYGNTVTNYSAVGMSWAGANNITLSVDGSNVGNWVTGNGQTYANPGVQFLNLYLTDYTYCHTSNITVYGLDADYNTQNGLQVETSGPCGTSITGVSVTQSQFCNNPPPSSSGGLYFDSTVSSPTTSAISCQ